jgi:hypothetical protein
VDYAEFLKVINWRDCPIAPLPVEPSKCLDNWSGTSQANQVTSVNYFALMEAIYGKAVAGGQC